MKYARHKKIIILTTIRARESQISVSTSTSNVPKHYCSKILSQYDRKTIFNTGEAPSQSVTAYTRKEIFSPP